MKNRSFIVDYHLMLIPGMLFVLIFSIVPMFGLIIAFTNYTPGMDIFKSPWVGLDNITFIFQLPDSKQVIMNTVVIACLKIVCNLTIPIVFSLLINEVRQHWFKRTVQTLIYLPHFLSWVILSGIIMDLLSYNGIANQIVKLFGFKPMLFMVNNSFFRPMLIVTDVYKEFGFNTIVYLAALAAINVNLYESAQLDGASRMQQLIYITIPGIAPTITLLATLSLGNVLNAGFDQIFNLYNPLVYSSSDIIDTYVYRIGLVQMQYGLATGVSLIKSVIGFVLITISYRLAYRYANYRIF